MDVGLSSQLLWNLIDAEANGVHVLAHLPLPPPVLLDEAHQEGAAALPVLLVLVLFLQLDQVLRIHPERVRVVPAAARGGAPPPVPIHLGEFPLLVAVTGECVRGQVADFQAGIVSQEVVERHPEFPILMLSSQRFPHLGVDCVPVWAVVIPLPGPSTSPQGFRMRISFCRLPLLSTSSAPVTGTRAPSPASGT